MRKLRASLWRIKGECTGGPRMSESLAVRRAGTSEAAISDGPVLSRGSTAITRVHQVLDALAARDAHGEILTAVRHFPAREARWADFPAWTHGDLRAAYAGKGIRQLYSHQGAAAEAGHAGKNVFIVTPTASGKTLCYNLPILNAILENSDTRALYLFPTKALAQDQLAELYDLNQHLENRFGVFTYDGDTPADARKSIRERGNIVLTNPDMLHTGILPHHTRWMRLFENLRYIVIDELHTYRGVFGSHLCNVLRRLRRIARFYGRDPQFICCSATIANPGDLASRLLESEVEVLNANGAPAAEKTFVFYNPPVVNRALGIRRSYINEASRVAQEFLKHDLQTMVFANSRLHTEILLTYLQQANPHLPGKPETIRGYRGGYLPNERREIERGLRDGKIRGVVSTSALELGIDVGSLDTVVMAGYPGTLAGPHPRRRARAGPRAPPQRKLLRRAGGFLRASRSIHRAPSRLFLRQHAGARLHPARQSGNPHQSSEMCCVRIAHRSKRQIRRCRRTRSLRAARRGRFSASSGRKIPMDAGGPYRRHRHSCFRHQPQF